MSLKRRVRRAGGARTAWGVIELRQLLDGDQEAWTAFWIQLGGRGTISVESDFADRANNICRDAFLRARHALGAPAHIVVLDQATARRVRAAVPSSLPVVVAPHPTLRRYQRQWEEAAREEQGAADTRKNTHSFFN